MTFMLKCFIVCVAIFHVVMTTFSYNLQVLIFTPSLPHSELINLQQIMFSCLQLFLHHQRFVIHNFKFDINTKIDVNVDVDIDIHVHSQVDENFRVASIHDCSSREYWRRKSNLFAIVTTSSFIKICSFVMSNMKD
jgi:hypothetical protein